MWLISIFKKKRKDVQFEISFSIGLEFADCVNNISNVVQLCTICKESIDLSICDWIWDSNYNSNQLYFTIIDDRIELLTLRSIVINDPFMVTRKEGGKTWYYDELSMFHYCVYTLPYT